MRDVDFFFVFLWLKRVYNVGDVAKTGNIFYKGLVVGGEFGKHVFTFSVDGTLILLSCFFRCANQQLF